MHFPKSLARTCWRMLARKLPFYSRQGSGMFTNTYRRSFGGENEYFSRQGTKSGKAASFADFRLLLGGLAARSRCAPFAFTFSFGFAELPEDVLPEDVLSEDVLPAPSRPVFPRALPVLLFDRLPDCRCFFAFGAAVMPLRLVDEERVEWPLPVVFCLPVAIFLLDEVLAVLRPRFRELS